MLPNYYASLRIRPDASPEEVRTAYRRLAKPSHPDAGGSSEAFQSVQEACEVLSDPVSRRRYDAARRSRMPRAKPCLTLLQRGYATASTHYSQFPLPTHYSPFTATAPSHARLG